MSLDLGELERRCYPTPDEILCEIGDAELLRRAVTHARATHTRGWHQRWVAAMDAFGLGSNCAAALCARYGLDPNERVRR